MVCRDPQAIDRMSRDALTWRQGAFGGKTKELSFYAGGAHKTINYM